MNKIWLFGAAVCMVLALGSCKPKQSAYKAAYEQAKEKESTAPVEVVEQEEEVVEVAPVSKPRTSTATTRTEKNVCRMMAITQCWARTSKVCCVLSSLVSTIKRTPPIAVMPSRRNTLLTSKTLGYWRELINCKLSEKIKAEGLVSL